MFNSRSFRIIVPFAIVFFLAAVFFLTFSYPLRATTITAPHDSSDYISGTLPPAPDSITHTVYLPVASKQREPEIKIGADFGYMTTFTDVVTIDFSLVKQLGGDWIRVWVPWAKIEQTPGAYDWRAYDAVFQQLDALDMQAIVILYHPPTWAADMGCGPITDPDALVDFTTALVSRYQEQVNVWEFINEPDGKEPHWYGPAIGCWGKYPQAYAQSLQLFYETVKGLDANALVFYGGLAYDAWEIFARDFFANTLAHGAGNYFDGLSFHYYPINPVEFPDVTYKLNELRDTMTQHGVTGKRIWITETSMWTNSDSGLAGQQDFIVKEYTRAYCAGAGNIFWYAISEDANNPPPLYRWLIDADHNLDNGHETFANFAQLMQGGVCDEPFSDLPADVEAHRFDTENGLVIVAWAATDSALLTVEADAPRLLLDREGNEIELLTPVAGQISMPVARTPRFLVVPE